MSPAGRTRGSGLRRRLGILAALLAATGWGCGGERAPATAGRGAPESPSPGGVAVVCLPTAPEGLDPFTSPDQASVDLSALLFTPLVRYGDEGGFRPYLARTWQWGPDHRELTFQIRSDVQWHDGVRLTAEDVAWTIGIAADTAFAYLNGADFRDLSRVTAPDSTTVVLRFSRPFTAGLEAFVNLPILPKHLLSGITASQFPRAEYHHAPVGSGPYRLVGWQPDGSIVFRRADNFPSDLGSARLDRIVVRTIPEATTREAELRTGEVDVCLATAQEAKALGRIQGLRTLPLEPVLEEMIVPDTRRGPLADVRVRRALSAALDRAQIAAVISPLASPAAGPLPAESPYRDPSLSEPDARPELADSLLTAAGWTRPADDGTRSGPGGASLQIHLLAPPQLRDPATVVQAQLARVGVDLELSFMEWASFLRTLQDPKTRPEAMLLGLSPEKVYRPDLYGTLASQGEMNVSSYADAALDSLLQGLQTATDSARLGQLYRGVQEIVGRNVPILYTAYVPRVLAVGPRVEDVKAGLDGPFADVAEWWIPTRRRRR